MFYSQVGKKAFLPTSPCFDTLQAFEDALEGALLFLCFLPFTFFKNIFQVHLKTHFSFLSFQLFARCLMQPRAIESLHKVRSSHNETRTHDKRTHLHGASAMPREKKNNVHARQLMKNEKLGGNWENGK